MVQGSQLYTGGCLCGNIRFEAVGPIDRPHSCSCKMCRLHSGAFTVTWAEFSAESVNWTGKGESPALYRSSEGSRRAFCNICGSSIGAVDDKPIIALLLGSFDKPDQAELVPQSESYKSSRPQWWHPEVHS